MVSYFVIRKVKTDYRLLVWKASVIFLLTTRIPTIPDIFITLYRAFNWASQALQRMRNILSGYEIVSQRRTAVTAI